MAIIKTLDILLRGQTGRLGSDLKKGSGLINRFATGVRSSLNGAFGRIVGLATTAAGFLSVAKAMSKVNEQFERIDKLAKSADRIGASVADMQALGLAASLAGGDFGKAEKSVQKFARLLGEAKGGDTTAIQAFERIGLAANSFDGLGAADSLGLVFDKISALDSQAEKTAVAMEIFGKSGAQMLNLIEGGSAGIRDAAADIDSFGGAISRVDAAQIELANDAWTRMSTLLEVVWANIATKVAPVFAALVEQFTGAAKESLRFSTAISSGFEILISGVDIANRAWHGFKAAIQAVRVSFVTLLSIILDGLATIESGLIKLGGSSFDFGLQNLADAAGQVAVELGGKMEESLGKAFGENNFADELKKKLEGIRQRAKEIADEANEKVFAAPIKPKIDWEGAFEKGKMEAFALGNTLLGIGRGLFGGAEKATEKATVAREDPLRQAAVTRFSADAQSAINNASSANSPAAVIKKTHKEAQKTRRDQENALKNIGKLLAKGTSVIVNLGG